MSLETQIAALVEAANNLTSEVAGKVNEIDSAVKSAVEGVPQAVLDNMGRTFWLHATNGDDTNDGAHSTRPLATIGEAIRRTPAGAALEIRIMSDYEMLPSDAQHRLAANQLLIRPDDLSQRFKISLAHRISSDGSIICYGIESFRNCLINLVSTNLHIPYSPDLAGKSINRLACFFPTHGSTDMPTPLSLRMANCDIDVEEPGINPISLTTGAGMLMLSTSNVSAPQAWLDQGRLTTENISTSDVIKGRVFVDGDHLA